MASQAPLPDQGDGDSASSLAAPLTDSSQAPLPDQGDGDGAVRPSPSGCCRSSQAPLPDQGDGDQALQGLAELGVDGRRPRSPIRGMETAAHAGNNAGNASRRPRSPIRGMETSGGLPPAPAAVLPSQAPLPDQGDGDWRSSMSVVCLTACVAGPAPRSGGWRQGPVDEDVGLCRDVAGPAPRSGGWRPRDTMIRDQVLTSRRPRSPIRGMETPDRLPR